MLRKQHRFFRSVLIASDGSLILFASVLAYFIRFDWLAPRFPVRDDPTFASHSVPILLATPLMLGALLSSGLYKARRDQRFYYEAMAIVKAVLIGLTLTVAATTLLRNTLYDGRNLSALQFGVYGITACSLLLCWRFSFRTALRYIRSRGWNLRHVAIIGSGRLGQVVAHTLMRNSWTGIKPRFFISHHPTTTRKKNAGLPVAGGLNDLERVMESTDMSGVLIALPARMAAELPSLLLRLAKFPVDVRIVPDMNPKHLPLNMAVSELDGMPILSIRESPLTGWGHVSKRTLDLVGSTVSLALFAIPMAVIAVLIRMSGPGPVIFRQDRMSLNGQRFKLFKFRTMKHFDAEAQALLDTGRGTDAWTKANDDRVTRIGKFLRRTSLDELPQLFNVLLGEMSLVGPRPERPELIQRFREDWRGYMLRQNVKAGMTGWAQINGLRGNTSLKKRLQYDLFYIRNWSLMFDLRILGMTIFRGFVHPNAH
ncbi:MAG: undecaprenyl-phosphate glucose phosphotransferase [Phycisphaerales bacterium]|nr:undecaprenyl-phosphate glucose phosphotransferase [Phycisphaerales bacterium]MCI0631839.1 undecaprenyl-phosphate glucose phosphotransferase [Phycisphaerales bacterium]MCI0674980.1 undecaprenyl-phosphate glucose phosphotransferase [Phycisphaerales bacterium]